MAEELDEQIWEQFLAQHQSLVSSLDTHASLLAQMRKHCIDGGPVVGLIETRLITTENMIATFKESTDSLREVVRQEEAPPKATSYSIPIVAAPEPHVSNPPVIDPSGLFTVDTNPTPLEHLFRDKTTNGDESKKHAKRKASDLENHAQVRNSGSGHAPQSKKARSNHQQSEEAVGEDDSFIRGVEARSRAKEERRKARTEKKRKRQSDGSTNSVNKGPKNKKQKQKHTPKLPATTKPVETQTKKGNKRNKEEAASNGAPNGRPIKKRKKSKS
ncbi:hypothetical protein A1O3_05492 [Capronia epimyces CBS 606.96]|uniref:Uncharacterized protein n=1 Tax=Capronia epimyces CBS 606.96 TaxID=1182542 RepID=W9YRC4_9EURO|nr:uncharacterized protein A1O3_05492 [Capronia epimyces CBS 606.96]EXJ84819.1 hypothetical protein A1O3_05492 [Capronia epimyces CBS 606.96]